MDYLLSTNAVIPNLYRIQEAQNAKDAESDMEDLRTLIRAVLDSGNDSKLLAFLGIEAQEMPEAIKTLQRTLEKTTAKRSDACDTLHEEFLESGIDAMRRLSATNTSVISLPFWTITKCVLFTGCQVNSQNEPITADMKWKSSRGLEWDSFLRFSMGLGKAELSP